MLALAQITREDLDPLQFVGDEADAPKDAGSPELVMPTGLTVFRSEPEAAPWREAKCLPVFFAECDARWPHRDHGSDGTIGDARHAAGWESSDHNPWFVVAGMGVVRAGDVDSDGISAAWLAEFIRSLGAAGDSRLNPNGYVIFNRRIASAQHGWVWRVYTGSDPHTGHVHMSLGTNARGFDRTGPWGIKAAPPPAPVHRHAMPTVDKHTPLSGAVRDLQGHLNAWRNNRRLSLMATDGTWDEGTEVALRTFQKAYRLTVDGVCGPTTWAKLHAITKGAVLWH